MDTKTEGSKFKLFNLPILKKLKSVKNIEVIFALVLGAIIILIFLSTFKFSSGSSTGSSSSYYYTSAAQYAEELEKKMDTILSGISGAGDVSVMITLDGSSELVIATSKEERNNSTSSTSSGTTVTTNTSSTIIETPVLVTENGESVPLVLQEIKPKIKGVIVVAQGADNIKVKLELLRAVVALLEVSADDVEIFTGK